MIITTTTGARYLCDVRGCPHAEETTTPGLPAGWITGKAKAGSLHADLCRQCASLFILNMLSHHKIGWMRRQPLTKRGTP